MNLSLAFRVTLGAMLLIVLFAAVVGYTVAELNRKSYLAERSASLRSSLTQKATQLASNMESLRRDTLLLSRTPPVHGFVRAVRHAGFDVLEGVSQAFWERRLPEVFSVFAAANPQYLQVRLIGVADGGRELVRVDRHGDRFVVAAADRLQTKGDRDYFLATAKLKTGDVHLSEIHLNQEQGKIETPHLRTIRAATPVFSSDGALFGMVVINLDIGPWMDAATTDLMPGVRAYLMNTAGDYLAHPDPERAFGFDLGRRYTWQEDMPGLQPPAGEVAGIEPLQALNAAEGLLHVAVEKVRFDPGRSDRFLLLAYALPDSVVGASATATRRTAAVATIGLTLLLGMGVFAYLRRAFAPLARMTELAESIGAGRYDVALPTDGVGEIGSFVRAFRNMLDRLRAREQALIQGEERFRGTLDNMLEGCQIIGFDWCYLYVNESAAMHGRRRRDELLGRKITDVYPGMEDSAAYSALVDCMSRRAAHRIESEFRYPDGAAAWFDVSIHPSPEGIFVVSYDITERKQAERKIREQLGNLNLLDRITRLIGERLDLSSIFQVVIRTLEESLPIDFGCIALSAGTAPAHSLNVAHVGAKSHALAVALKLAEGGTIRVDDNGLGRCVQGELVYEADIGNAAFAFPRQLAQAGLRSLVMAPLRSESRVFGVVVVARCEPGAFTSAECEFLRQLSEHVALAAHQAQLYSALQAAYDDLRRTQQAVMQQERLRALGQMASGIAHDINNALSPVSLYAESLLETERGLSDRARSYLQTIRRAVEDVAETVARLREFYRAREVQLALVPVDVNELIRQVIDLTRARWSDMPQQRGIVIREAMELAADLPMVMGVESEIREALTNLVFNAIDAMPQGGALTLRTSIAPAHRGSAQAHVLVEIQDEGVGMDAETRRRCLEPFFTTKGEQGTGLGLAMVYGTMQRHGAEMEVDSTLGSGTTVHLVFPVPAAPPLRPAPPGAVLVPPSRLRLLLIDDDPILLKSLRDTLETDGHVVVDANGGQAGIDAFRAAHERGERFAAVITDLGMPYVDGRLVAEAVKTKSPATPVILLTGWGQRLIGEGDIPPYVDLVLAKPPKLHELRGALAQLCPPALTPPMGLPMSGNP